MIAIDIPPAARFAPALAIISSHVAHRRVCVTPPPEHPTRLRGEGTLVGIQTLGGVVTMCIVAFHGGLEASIRPDWVHDAATLPDNVVAFRRAGAARPGWSVDLFRDAVRP
jgi:hypothetical protein